MTFYKTLNINENIKNKINVIFLFLFIFFLPLGSALPSITIGPVTFYVFRVITIFLFIYLLLTKQLLTNTYLNSRIFIGFIIIWIIYACISLFWSQNIYHAIKDISYLIWSLLISVSLLSLLSNTKKAYTVIEYSWFLVFSLLTALAYWEIFTTGHIHGSFTESFTVLLGYYYEAFRSPITTFTNPNDYASYILFTFPFIFYRFKPFKLILLIMALIPLYFTYSRFAVITIYALIILFLFYYRKIILSYLKKFKLRISFSIGIIIICGGLIISKNKFSIPIIEKNKGISIVTTDFFDIKNVTNESLLPLEFLSDMLNKPDSNSSINVRKNLIKNGLYFFITSYGFGIGAGQFQVYTSQHKGPYYCHNITDPHNWVIEILSQYGIFIFLLLLFVFWRIFKVVIRPKQIEQNELYFMFLQGFIIYAIMSNSSSTFISMTTNWVYLTFLVFVSDKLKYQQYFKNNEYSEKKHICHISSVHPFDDIRIFHKQCKSLSKAGYKVSLVTFSNNNSIIEDVNIISAGRIHTKRLARMLIGTYKIYKTAKRLKADIYHLHDAELLPYGLLLLWSGKKVIYDIHEDIEKQTLSKYYIKPAIRKITSKLIWIIERFVAKKLTYCLTATEAIKQKFIQINPHTEVINNYPLISELNLDINVEINSKQNSICYIGAITEIRGCGNLIDAMEYTNGITLEIAGTISPQSFENELKQKKGWGKVIFHNQISRKEVYALMERCKIGVVIFFPEPNHIDAKPNKIFEYMSAGLPVICSNFPLWKELIVDNNCGYCVNPEDVNEIANAINDLISKNELTSEMSKNCRKLIKDKYNWSIEEKKIISIYSTILNS